MKKTIIFIVVPMLMLLTSCASKTDIAQSGETNTSTNALSNAEQEFNDSGRAKAIESESDMWQIYEDKDIGFSFKYPIGTNLITEENYTLDPNQSYIKVEIKNIGDKVAPNDLTKEEDMKNIEDLSAGKFGVNYDNPIQESKKVDTVGNIFGQDFLVLSRFDVCNVTVERVLVFYFNNKKIILTSYAPTSTLRTSATDYFMLDEANCGQDTRWDFDKQKDFYQSLVDNKGPQDIQIWYNDFDKMLETITFDHK
ncbi:MAG: hypothetical protein PHN31_04890 [Candidatus Gracilibacteria bacterium]|nr:hypothetical protein [Candidatus Gracilibacteria bacterium]